MPGTFRFINILFHASDMRESLDTIDSFVRERTPRMVFTLSAELIARAQSDPELREIYAQSALLTIDSYVVYYSARLCGKPVKEPVSAARLMCGYLPRAAAANYRIYLMGASEDVVAKVAAALRAQYPGIIIAGWHNGYFDTEGEQAIVKDIQNTKPDLLFVAMSSPLKERFIHANLGAMNVPVSIGVGGIFDIIAGKCRLAPPLISRLGLEWLYRFAQEPRRMWKRYLITNTKYMALVGRELFKRGG